MSAPLPPWRGAASVNGSRSAQIASSARASATFTPCRDPDVAGILLLIGRDHRLTPVLLERLIEIASGDSNTEIADRHRLSVNTVKTEVAAVLSSLRFECRHQLQMLARHIAFQLAEGDEQGAVLSSLRYHFG